MRLQLFKGIHRPLLPREINAAPGQLELCGAKFKNTHRLKPLYTPGKDKSNVRQPQGNACFCPNRKAEVQTKFSVYSS